jgi:triacylglycerol esterase/lipase EstA (alpha/beta hydrolase family)
MMLVAALLALLLSVAMLLVALSVLVSFSLARQARTPVKDGEFAPLPLGLMLHESACLLRTVLWRPLGWLPPRVTPGDANKPPVLLLHGLFQNRSCLCALQRRLQRAGYRTMSINTPPWHDLATLTQRVGLGVDRLRAVTGPGQVHLVGHSMGGILARSYLQQAGTGHVVSCVTIGAPHTGSQLAVFAVSRLGRALLPGSPLLAQLNAGPPPTGIKLTAIYSRDDNIIVPAQNARLEGADNLEVSGIGHTAMLFSGEVAKVVVASLNACA